MALQIIEGTTAAKTVVFLPGYLLTTKQWSKLALSRAPWRSILIDLPDHGMHKEVVLKEQSMRAYAHFICEQLKNENIGRYSLVGHSMGGYVGLEMLKLDKKLDKLILLHSNIWEDSPERKKNRERVVAIVKRNKALFLRETLPLLFKNKSKHQDSISDIVKEASSMTADGIAYGALSMKNRTNQFDLVQKNAARCFFIQGSHDALIPADEAKDIWAKFAKDDHFFLIPDCGHMSHIERPRTLRKVLEALVDL